MAALDHVLDALGHVVAQVIETELVVRPVGDIGFVLLAALVGALADEDAAGGESEEGVDARHDVGLVLGEVVVDRDDVDALAGERPQIGRHGRDEGLALTGLHLGDVALVQGDPAHDLHVEGPHAEDAPRGLPHGREGLDEQVVQGLALGEARLELLRLRLEIRVAQGFEVLLKGVDLTGELVELLEGAPFACAKDLVDEGHEDSCGLNRGEGPVRVARTRSVYGVRGPDSTRGGRDSSHSRDFQRLGGAIPVLKGPPEMPPAGP